MTVFSTAIKNRADEILRILRSKLQVRAGDFASLVVNEESHDPFRVLIVIILSQSCTDIAAIKAYRTLEEQIGITVNTLAHANIREISNSIRSAGLQRQKSKALRQLARIISQKYTGDLSEILHKPISDARDELQTLPKVGPKTADVLLSIYGKPTISVDTHVERVSKRLALTHPKAKYEKIRADLMQLFDLNDYGNVPLLFMAHGRKYCKAIGPLCATCPVRQLCPYAAKT